MKKFICLALVALICLVAVGCGSDVEIPDGMKLASGDDEIYYFFVPSSWEVKRGYDMPYAYYSATEPSNVNVTIYYPDETSVSTDGAEDPRAPYIYAYWEKFSKEAAELKEYTLVETKTSKLGGVFAKEYIYTEKTGGTVYRHRAAVTYYGELIVSLTYTATEENFDTHLGDVNSIFAEFKFKQ